MITDNKTANGKRWLRKARQCFAFRKQWGPDGCQRQHDRALDLARDIWRTLDPEGFKRAG